MGSVGEHLAQPVFRREVPEVPREPCGAAAVAGGGRLADDEHAAHELRGFAGDDGPAMGRTTPRPASQRQAGRIVEVDGPEWS